MKRTIVMIVMMILTISILVSAKPDGVNFEFNERTVRSFGSDDNSMYVIQSSKEPDSYLEKIGKELYLVKDAGRANIITEFTSEMKIRGDVENRARITFFDDVSDEDKLMIVQEHGSIVFNGKKSMVLDNFRGIDELAEDENVFFIEPYIDYEEYNDGIRSTIRLSYPQSTFDINGSGIVVAEWDGGWVGSHQDFTDRVTIGDAECVDTACSISDHATHVAGIMAGAGIINPALRGISVASSIISWEWPNNEDEIYNETNISVSTYSASISQNSWGYGGDCNKGVYDSISLAFDKMVYGDTTKADDVISIVFSSGNEGENGYNSICGPGGTAKNVITVGSIDYDDMQISSFSSIGPTNDGRIKPDVVAPGCGTYSSHKITSTFPNDAYGTMCGTSMAAPAVSGLLLSVYQAYNDTNGALPTPATGKAILIHSADDLGNTGPDYTYGWGLVNATKALQLAKDTSGNIIDSSVAQDITNNYTYNLSSDLSEFKATLVWSDPDQSIYANWELATDLDIYVTAPNGTQFFSWKLNNNSPSDPATKASGLGSTDYINNVEQVLIEDPIQGLYNISVRGYYVTDGPQDYAVIMSQLDEVGPQLEFVLPTPENGSSNTSTTYTINVTVTDISQIMNCTFEIDGINTTIDADLTNSTSCSKDVSLIDATDHTFKVYAADYYSNIANTSLRTITVENTAPEVNASESGNISSIENSTLNITLDVYDINGDSLTYNWTLNNTQISTDMNLSYTFNMTQSGFYNLSVNVSDGTDFTSLEWNLTVNDTNNTPEVNVTVGDGSLFTNENMICNYTYYDVDGHALNSSTIKWYRNGTVQNAFENYSQINVSATQKNQNWTCEVTVVDGFGAQATSNGSAYIYNSPPSVQNVSNVEVNETDLINITLTATDADSDTLTYSSNLSYLSNTENYMTWQTNSSSYGVYFVVFNISDGENVTQKNATITVKNLVTLDSNVTKISSPVVLKVYVNNSITEGSLSGLNEINITDETDNPVVEFDWNFSNSTLTNFTVDYSADNGTIVIKDLNLTGQGLTKTVFINKASSTYNYVCIKDAEVSSITELSSDCTGTGELKLACPGTSGNYACSVVGERFRVSGLSNSAVKGLYYSTGGTVPRGGGGGSSGTDSLIVETAQLCVEDWICTQWSDCVDGMMTKECFDANTCPTQIQKPLTEKECTVEIEDDVAVEDSFDDGNSNDTDVTGNAIYTPDESDDSDVLDAKEAIYLFIAGMSAFLLVVMIIYRR